MKTLGATEFIDSFINLGINKFQYNSKNVDNKNVSFDGVDGKTRDVVAFGIMFSVMNRRNDDYQINASKTMKINFLSKIRKNLKDIHMEQLKEFIYEYEKEFYGYDDDYDLDIMLRRRWR